VRDRITGIPVCVASLGTVGSVEVYDHRAKQVIENGAKLRKGVDYTFDASAQILTIPFKGGTKLTIQGAGSLF
jgi:hypothetical protein